MHRRSIIGLGAVSALVMAFFADSANGQEDAAKQILGTWSLVSVDSVRPDDNKSSIFGANPMGIAFFDAAGRFIITIIRSDGANNPINDPAKAKAGENRPAVRPVLTYFGSYSVNEPDRAIDIHIDGSSFPNWNGTDQKRTFTIMGDDLKLTNPGAAGAGSVEVVWKRVK